MDIPYGYCHCGCGGKTKIAERDNKYRGYIKGEPRRFIYGHHVGKREDHPNWRGGTTIDSKGGHPMSLNTTHHRSHQNGYVYDHIIKAEIALGKPLPEVAVIHHHTKDELVICEDQAYHILLHLRTKALAECGHASWRKCSLCGQYDSIENLYVPPRRGSAYHRNCHAQKELERRHRA